MKKLVTWFVIIVIGIYGGVAIAGPPYISGRGDKNISTDYSHHENHSGKFYSVAFANALASGDKLHVLINTTGIEYAHLVGSVRVIAEAYVEFWEDATVTALGTALESTNHNRVSTNASSLAVTIYPTLSSGGDKLDGLTQHIGSGQKAGGEARAESEIILETDKLYFLNIVSEAANNEASVILQYYESDDYY